MKNLVSKMTLDEKVGAVLTLGFSGTIAMPHIYEFITKYHCGGLRLSPTSRSFGSYVNPKSGETVVNVVDEKGFKIGIEPPTTTASQYKELLDGFQELAMSRPHGIPLHFAFDQEGGTSSDFNFSGVNIFTKPMGIRSTGDSKLAYEVALAVSKQSKAVGFNWIHSPVIDVNVDSRNPEVYTRSYSDRVEEVVEYSEQSCLGFKEGGLIATGKHFPGRGDSPVDAHFEVPIINVDKVTMLKRELLPYKVLIEKDLLPSIMIAHSIFPAFDSENIATVSKKILTGLLREELKFEGVIATDSMTMGAIATRYGVANACALSLEAGADLVLMKAEGSLVEETFNTIKQFLQEGRISAYELDKKVYRVLNTKYEYGLFNYEKMTDEKPENVINDKRIIALSKLVARKSVLVARDRSNLLPLNKEEKILIIEQINKTPNDFTWHPGILFKKCSKYNKNVTYLETSYTFDEQDIENIRRRVNDFDTIVVTNFYIRGKLANNDIIKEIAGDKSKKVILVTNTPYEVLSIPKEADSVIITFATSPANIEVVAGVIFGEVVPEGEWPIEYKLGK
ncbi:MAG: glycoside hydrolase family 3 N-terminal domain-containing protein [Clostridium sp.]|uniref:glycoside hydrolase family 3 protein n=1 Tax=Clostridium sp. TaxID=1506 RepID=UPI003D6CA255